MTITVNCRCGAQYNLKDEYWGKTVKCKQCNTPIAVPHLTIKSQSDPVTPYKITRVRHLLSSAKITCIILFANAYSLTVTLLGNFFGRLRINFQLGGFMGGVLVALLIKSPLIQKHN